MKIGQFIQGRGVERQAVSRYINRHKEEFNGHISKDGKEMELDSYAVSVLEEVYPLAKPVTIIEGVPHEEYIRLQEELINSHKIISDLQNRLIEQQNVLTDMKVSYALLETKEKTIDDELTALKEELEQEKSKTWFQKLLKR